MPICPFCTKAVPAGSTICPHCLRALPLAITTAPTTTNGRAAHSSRGWLRPALLTLIALAGGAYVLRDYHRAPSPDDALDTRAAPGAMTIAPPLDVRIADTSSVVIPAGGHLAFPFTGGGRSGCRIRGSVQALSGGDRRVKVIVVDRDGLADVESGKPPHSYYDSGPRSDVALEVNLDGRTAYTFVVSNPGRSRRATAVRIRNLTARCSD
jgi:hypothetical protein